MRKPKRLYDEEGSISFEGATPLLNSDDWFWEDGLPTTVDYLIHPWVSWFLDDELLWAELAATAPWVMDPETASRGHYRPIDRIQLRQYSASVAAMTEYLTQGAERKFVRWPEVSQPTVFDSLGHDIRVGRRGGAILKIGPTANAVTWRGLSIIGAILTFSNWQLLSLLATTASVAANLKAIVAALCSAYERLDDPRERFVFELIFFLQGKYTVTNHDALEARDYATAYGLLSPTLSDIEEAIMSPELSNLLPEQWRIHVEGDAPQHYRSAPPERWAGELRETMYALRDRNVLTDNRGRWNIVW